MTGLSDDWNGLGFNVWDLKEIVLPDTIEEIEDYAFKNCYQLEKINMPSSLRRIGKEAFRGCISLKDFNVPDNVEVRRRCI